METELPDIDSTWFKCIDDDCKYKVSLESNNTFKCPKCGHLQRIEHDFSDYEKNPCLKDSMKNLFKERSPQHVPEVQALYKSGVWKFSGKHGLIMPDFPIDKMLSCGEGNEPILEVGPNLEAWLDADIELFIMMQGMNPTGAFKDRGMPVAVSVAYARGVKAIICASTGDTSAAAALYAALAGIQCYVLIPEDKEETSVVQWHQPDAYGAKTIVIPGKFDDGMKTVQELADTGNIFIANSRNSLRIEGHKSTPIRIAEYFNWEMPDAIFMPVGNGSNSSSNWEGLHLLRMLGFVDSIPKLIGVQVRAASPLYNSWKIARGTSDSITESKWKQLYNPVKVGKTVATAMKIGDPVSRIKVIHGICESKGGMEAVSEEELIQAMDTANKDGLPVCPQSAAALAGVKKACKAGLIKKGSRVVVISTASQMKFPETLAQHRPMDIIKAPDCSIDSIAKILDL